MKKVIGITGYAGSGKGTIASYLVKNFGYKEVALADKIKQVVSEVFGIPLETCYSQEGKAKTYPELAGKTLRYALQHLGTEGFRHLNSDVWINYLIQTIESSEHDKFVISDVRFPNETMFLDWFPNSALIGVTRENKIDFDYVHESEVHIPYMLELSDKVLLNNGTIEELETKALNFVCNWNFE